MDRIAWTRLSTFLMYFVGRTWVDPSSADRSGFAGLMLAVDVSSTAQVDGFMLSLPFWIAALDVWVADIVTEREVIDTVGTVWM